MRAGGFLPPPKVDSAVVELVPYPEGRVAVKDAKRFSQVVHAAFQMRRKTLRNALSGLVDESVLRAAWIDPGTRGETLSVADFVRLANVLGGDR